jgi:hypothetical protein
MFVGQDTVRNARRSLSFSFLLLSRLINLSLLALFIYSCSVLAQVDAKMVRPEPQRPFEGLITIHCELSPMASMEYEPGRYVHQPTRTHLVSQPLNSTSPVHLRRPSDEEVALARMLDKIFRRSDTIDREALCIIAGERVRPSSSLSSRSPNNPLTHAHAPRSGTSASQSTHSQTQAASSTAQA